MGITITILEFSVEGVPVLADPTQPEPIGVGPNGTVLAADWSPGSPPRCASGWERAFAPWGVLAIDPVRRVGG